MHPVIDGRLAFRFLQPDVQRFPQSLTLALDGKVNDRSGTSTGSRDSPGAEIVSRNAAHEWQLHMGVGINPAGHDIHAFSVDDLITQKFMPDEGDGLTVHTDIGLITLSGCDNRAVFDDFIHASLPPAL